MADVFVRNRRSQARRRGRDLGEIPLSTGEIEYLTRVDKAARRRQRLLQVREQEKRAAQLVTQRYRDNLKKLQGYRMKYAQQDHRHNQDVLLSALHEKYQFSLQNMGAAQRNAREKVMELVELAQVEQRKWAHNRRGEKERFNDAVDGVHEDVSIRLARRREVERNLLRLKEMSARQRSEASARAKRELEMQLQLQRAQEEAQRYRMQHAESEEFSYPRKTQKDVTAYQFTRTHCVVLPTQTDSEKIKVAGGADGFKEVKVIRHNRVQRPAASAISQADAYRLEMEQKQEEEWRLREENAHIAVARGQEATHVVEAIRGGAHALDWLASIDRVERTDATLPIEPSNRGVGNQTRGHKGPGFDGDGSEVFARLFGIEETSDVMELSGSGYEIEEPQRVLARRGGSIDDSEDSSLFGGEATSTNGRDHGQQKELKSSVEHAIEHKLHTMDQLLQKVASYGKATPSQRAESNEHALDNAQVRSRHGEWDQEKPASPDGSDTRSSVNEARVGARSGPSTHPGAVRGSVRDHLPPSQNSSFSGDDRADESEASAQGGSSRVFAAVGLPPAPSSRDVPLPGRTRATSAQQGRTVRNRHDEWDQEKPASPDGSDTRSSVNEARVGARSGPSTHPGAVRGSVRDHLPPSQNSSFSGDDRADESEASAQGGSSRVFAAVGLPPAPSSRDVPLPGRTRATSAQQGRTVRNRHDEWDQEKPASPDGTDTRSSVNEARVGARSGPSTHPGAVRGSVRDHLPPSQNSSFSGDDRADESEASAQGGSSRVFAAVGLPPAPSSRDVPLPGRTRATSAQQGRTVRNRHDEWDQEKPASPDGSDTRSSVNEARVGARSGPSTHPGAVRGSVRDHLPPSQNSSFSGDDRADESEASAQGGSSRVFAAVGLPPAPSSRDVPLPGRTRATSAQQGRTVRNRHDEWDQEKPASPDGSDTRSSVNEARVGARSGPSTHPGAVRGSVRDHLPPSQNSSFSGDDRADESEASAQGGSSRVFAAATTSPEDQLGEPLEGLILSSTPRVVAPSEMVVGGGSVVLDSGFDDVVDGDMSHLLHPIHDDEQHVGSSFSSFRQYSLPLSDSFSSIGESHISLENAEALTNKLVPIFPRHRPANGNSANDDNGGHQLSPADIPRDTPLLLEGLAPQTLGDDEAEPLQIQRVGAGLFNHEAQGEIEPSSQELGMSTIPRYDQLDIRELNNWPETNEYDEPSESSAGDAQNLQNRSFSSESSSDASAYMYLERMRTVTQMSTTTSGQPKLNNRSTARSSSNEGSRRNDGSAQSESVARPPLISATRRDSVSSSSSSTPSMDARFQYLVHMTAVAGKALPLHLNLPRDITDGTSTGLLPSQAYHTNSSSDSGSDVSEGNYQVRRAQGASADRETDRITSTSTNGQDSEASPVSASLVDFSVPPEPIFRTSSNTSTGIQVGDNEPTDNVIESSGNRAIPQFDLEDLGQRLSSLPPPPFGDFDMSQPPPPLAWIDSDVMSDSDDSNAIDDNDARDMGVESAVCSTEHQPVATGTTTPPQRKGEALFVPLGDTGRHTTSSPASPEGMSLADAFQARHPSFQRRAQSTKALLEQRRQQLEQRRTAESQDETLAQSRGGGRVQPAPASHVNVPPRRSAPPQSPALIMPKPELLDRLATGQRAKISAEEMRERTRRLYNQLPEVTERKRQEDVLERRRQRLIELREREKARRQQQRERQNRAS